MFCMLKKRKYIHLMSQIMNLIIQVNDSDGEGLQLKNYQHY